MIPARSRSPPPTIAPTSVPSTPNDHEYFNKWLNSATVDQLNRFYTDVLIPEYLRTSINQQHKTEYMNRYTEIYKRIIAQTTGISYAFNLVTTWNDQTRLNDITDLKELIKNMIGQINIDRMTNSRQRSSLSMQHEPMTTVRTSDYNEMKMQLGQCMQRENARKKHLDSEINLAIEEIKLLEESGEGGEGKDLSDKILVKKRRLAILLQQQQQQQRQQQQGRGGGSKRSKRAKRVNRSKRVKRSKRSSTKRQSK